MKMLEDRVSDRLHVGWGKKLSFGFVVRVRYRYKIDINNKGLNFLFLINFFLIDPQLTFFFLRN